MLIIKYVNVGKAKILDNAYTDSLCQLCAIS